MSTRPKHLFACALFVGACATGTKAAPHVEAPTQAEAPREPIVRVASALEVTKPVCTAHEASQPNALDDDCDGRIDQLPNGPGLSVAFSTASAAELALTLRDAQGNEVAPTQSDKGSAPCESPTFRTASAHYASLPQAPGQLVLKHVRSCGEPVPATVAIALATAQGAQSYLVTLEPGASLTLAELVPAP